MKYDFHAVEEIAWVAAVAAGTFALEVLIRFDPETMTDWQTWAISLGGGMVRAAVGAVIAYRTRPR